MSLTPAIPSFIKVADGARIATDSDDNVINRTEVTKRQMLGGQRQTLTSAQTVHRTEQTLQQHHAAQSSYSKDYIRKVSTSDAPAALTADQFIQSDSGHIQTLATHAKASTGNVGYQTTSYQISREGGISADHYIGPAATAATHAAVIATSSHREFGEQRLVSRTERVDESRSHIISERVQEREIMIPKRVVMEEVIERTIVIPEKVRREEVVNSSHLYKEKIIERSKPIIVEKVIEVPEVEYVERIVEEPEIIYDTVEIPRPIGEPKVVEEIEYVDKFTEVENIVKVDVNKPVYYEVPVPKIVEHEVIHYEKVKVPVPCRVPVIKAREVPIKKEVTRKLPVPVAVDAEYEYRVPQLRPVYSKQTFAMFVPRFIQVPVPREMLSDELAALTESHLNKIQAFTSGHPSLCEIETVAAQIRQSNVQKELSEATAQDAVKRAWDSGNLDLIKAQ